MVPAKGGNDGLVPALLPRSKEARRSRSPARRPSNLHEQGLPFGKTIIVPFAQAEDGNLGGGIQDLQAGLVPDDVAFNTCNDG